MSNASQECSRDLPPVALSSPPKDLPAIVLLAHRLEKVIGQFCQFVLLATGLALLVILMAVVVLRYSELGSIDSGAELSALIFPVFVTAGIVEAARTGAHVATQILLNALNGAWKLRLIVLIHTVTASAYLYLSTFAFRNAIIAHDELSTILEVPGSFGYGCLTVGLAFVGICSLTAIVRHTFGNEPVVVNFADAGPGVV
ncbi:TRAP transporter small permease [Propionivibrio dicarboxylicus]|uniref:TRAP transporter small permease protein n=1 Tax=Propionivibrio dicarboxylicus TaxID=83767 RepID=A0A1G8KDW5_9RHOO|nr:TRAP transporter small permease subunit [Propionivibrio dicarboxylicus]SDI41603.1 TRAP-type C4-dicarboxylate transport system, small permease component [Propionivibrio dicarboxylicus]